jgi:hypothetical protein
MLGRVTIAVYLLMDKLEVVKVIVWWDMVTTKALFLLVVKKYSIGFEIKMKKIKNMK